MTPCQPLQSGCIDNFRKSMAYLNIYKITTVFVEQTMANPVGLLNFIKFLVIIWFILYNDLILSESQYTLIINGL